MTMIGVDIGGTFTDFIIAERGSVRIHKRPSTPRAPAEAFLKGLEEASVAPGTLEKAVHGTTVGTNTMIERRGARAGLITTSGFRDTLEIGRGIKPMTDYFNLRWTAPAPLVPRELRCEVSERIAPDGSIVDPLDEAEVEAALEFLSEQGCDSVAVCLLFSYANPVHERRIAEIAAKKFPALSISTSSDLLPQWREYERTSTTAGDAYIKPVMARYFTALEDKLAAGGLDRDLFIMKSNGGLMTSRTAKNYPIHTFLSGPAAAALAGKFIGKSAGYDNVITTDMGGTSFDLSLVRDNELAYRTEGEIDVGIPVLIPTIDIRTLGAGGGSISWIDAGGALKVGPQSAGADPGPACYSRGGTKPTVTDANLLLGRLGTEAALGGSVRLDRDKSVKAIQQVAEPLGLEVEKVAKGIIDICINNIVHEVRAISAQQGIDPRAFAMIAAGGAGPLHVAPLAEVLGMRTVIVPPRPGLLSASGLLLADLRFDSVRSWPLVLERGDLGQLNAVFDEMVGEALHNLEGEGFGGKPTLIRLLDMRYEGQNWEISVPVPAGEISSEVVAAAFDTEHERLYGIRIPNARHEVVNLRVTAIGPQADPTRWLPSIQTGVAGPPASRRKVYDHASDRYVEAPIYDRETLVIGQEFEGLCIVDQIDTTLFVPFGWKCKVDNQANIVMTRKD
ncbi:hydantoinase/oxoprolinase family protein [Mesorhizobium sp. M1329]|uniref:hydantoinase/oxoprolinase family protein n=1 Tax=Mesorhizobium sp. M1329 TaxID=2957083 RepID=UPI00333BFEC0